MPRPACAILLLAAVGIFARVPSSDAPTIDFARDVKPIFDAHCIKCHGPMKQRGGLRLDTRAALTGGDSGALLVPGKSGESLLLKVVTHPNATERMPQNADPLSAEQIATLRAWIDQGARWDDTVVNDPHKTHWAFQPVVRPTPPTVKNTAWPRNPIDRFILARLEKEDLAPNVEAEPTVFLRRLKFDLLGL